MRLTLHTFLTLDGVLQAPGGPEEDPDGGFPYGGWSFPYGDDDFGVAVAGEALLRGDVDEQQRPLREVPHLGGQRPAERHDHRPDDHVPHDKLRVRPAHLAPSPARPRPGPRRHILPTKPGPAQPPGNAALTHSCIGIRFLATALTGEEADRGQAYLHDDHVARRLCG